MEKAASGSGAGTFGPVKIVNKTKDVGEGALMRCVLTAFTNSAAPALEKAASTRERMPSGHSAPEISNISSKTSGTAKELSRHFLARGPFSKASKLALASLGESAKATPVTMQTLLPGNAAFSFSFGGASSRKRLNSMLGDSRAAISPSQPPTAAASSMEK